MSSPSSSEEELGPNDCELCEREMPLTDHHLYPKDQHKRMMKRNKMSRDKLLSTITKICRPCHTAIHKLFGNKELADRLYSIELLCEEEKIINHVNYIRKQRVYTKNDALAKGVRYHR